MHPYLALIVHTANILGIFNDPFEFEGDYGAEMNASREIVFEAVVTRESLAQNLSESDVQMLMDSEGAGAEEVATYKQLLVKQANEQDRNHGPTLGELLPPQLLKQVQVQREALNDARFTAADMDAIVRFVEKHKDQKVFRLMRNIPSELLSIDKILRDAAAREGKPFDIPILSSTGLLEGANSFELKMNLIGALITDKCLGMTKSPDAVLKGINAVNQQKMNDLLGPAADTTDLAAFASPGGQVVFYWMYQALNLHLVAEDPSHIAMINETKAAFAGTLGNAQMRADILKQKLLASGSDVLFTQESDALVPQVLAGDGMYLPADLQNNGDGTFVFLRQGVWEPDYQVIPIDGYEGYAAGALNVIMATHAATGQQFLLAAAHGHSTKPEDGRLQITLIMEKYRELNQGGLQLVIGIDANTKSDKDVADLRSHLDALGLMATDVGPTTIKKRMVTAQHSKAGRAAVDQEDFIITLKPEFGGCFQMTSQTVGFKEGRPDPSVALPNMDNPSDHYSVGAVLQSIPQEGS